MYIDIRICTHVNMPISRYLRVDACFIMYSTFCIHTHMYVPTRDMNSNLVFRLSSKPWAMRHLAGVGFSYLASPNWHLKAGLLQKAASYMGPKHGSRVLVVEGGHIRSIQVPNYEYHFEVSTIRHSTPRVCIRTPDCWKL